MSSDPTATHFLFLGKYLFDLAALLNPSNCEYRFERINEIEIYTMTTLTCQWLKNKSCLAPDCILPLVAWLVCTTWIEKSLDKYMFYVFCHALQLYLKKSILIPKESLISADMIITAIPDPCRYQRNDHVTETTPKHQYKRDLDCSESCLIDPA